MICRKDAHSLKHRGWKQNPNFVTSFELGTEFRHEINLFSLQWSKWLTRQTAHFRLYSNFIFSGSVKVSVNSVASKSHGKELKSSLELLPFEALKFKQKAPSSINHGDCRISKCSALIVDLKFLPLTEPWIYKKIFLHIGRKEEYKNAHKQSQKKPYLVILLKDFSHSSSIHHCILH